MQKVCENCNNTFNTKDPRQKSCGKSCAAILRKLNTRKTVVTAKATSLESSSGVGQLQKLQMELPPPEELPAPYAKRVHDMWATLVGGDSAPTRVA